MQFIDGQGLARLRAAQGRASHRPTPPRTSDDAAGRTPSPSTYRPAGTRCTARPRTATASSATRSHGPSPCG